MPTSRAAASSTSTDPLTTDAPADAPAEEAPPAVSLPSAEDLKHALERAPTTTVYLDPSISLTDEQLAALVKDGIHAELDVVRGCVAVRAASPEEIAEATAPPAEAEAEPAAA